MTQTIIHRENVVKPTKLQRIMTVIMFPATVWYDTWLWIGEMTDDGTNVGFFKMCMCRAMWVVVTALFVFLWAEVIWG